MMEGMKYNSKILQLRSKINLELQFKFCVDWPSKRTIYLYIDFISFISYLESLIASCPKEISVLHIAT